VFVTTRSRHYSQPNPKRSKSRPKLAQWLPLIRHVEHGQTRLDNNLVENAIRPSAVGKKNWLLIGHPDAGRRSAILYSVIVSCQRHGVWSRSPTCAMSWRGCPR
jgi:hypothetical protein